RAQLRERERVDRVDDPVPRGAARRTNPDLRVEARVVRPRLQVAPDHADRPVAEAGQTPDLVRGLELTELDEARVLDEPVVRAENVVEPTDTVRVAARPRARTVEVADRLGRLDRLAGLVDVTRQEVEVRPVTALVPHVAAERAV